MKTHLWCQSLPAESFSNWPFSLQDQSKRLIIGAARGWAGGHGAHCFLELFSNLLFVYMLSSPACVSLCLPVPLSVAAAISGIIVTCCLPSARLFLLFYVHNTVLRHEL